MVLPPSMTKSIHSARASRSYLPRFFPGLVLSIRTIYGGGAASGKTSYKGSCGLDHKRSEDGSHGEGSKNSSILLSKLWLKSLLDSSEHRSESTGGLIFLICEENRKGGEEIGLLRPSAGARPARSSPKDPVAETKMPEPISFPGLAETKSRPRPTP